MPADSSGARVPRTGPSDGDRLVRVAYHLSIRRQAVDLQRARIGERLSQRLSGGHPPDAEAYLGILALDDLLRAVRHAATVLGDDGLVDQIDGHGDLRVKGLLDVLRGVLVHHDDYFDGKGRAQTRSGWAVSIFETSDPSITTLGSDAATIRIRIGGGSTSPTFHFSDWAIEVCRVAGSQREMLLRRAMGTVRRSE